MLRLTFIPVFLFIVLAVVSTFKKHRNLYLKGKITRNVFLRNTALDIFGLLLATALAGLLGRYLSQTMTLRINQSLTGIMISILIGLLIGACVGLIVKRTWGRLITAQ